ncbi:MAG: selenocysteine lyase, partial [Bacteroidota bacterium]
MTNKPGWVRLSVHPTMTNAEIEFIMDAIEKTASQFHVWMKDYKYDAQSNEYLFNESKTNEFEKIEKWFDFSNWYNR